MHALLSHDVFEVEIAHALTRAERQARIATGQAAIVWSDVLSTPLFQPPVGHPPLFSSLAVLVDASIADLANHLLVHYLERTPQGSRHRRLL